ncbi:hypothetical protein V6N13_057279 [Hibiscus sabdariffa]
MNKGEGRIEATKGRISVDRGSKATLPLKIPRRVFKSYAKDSTRCSVEITLQGSTRDFPTRVLHPQHVTLGAICPTTGQQSGDRRMRRF